MTKNANNSMTNNLSKFEIKSELVLVIFSQPQALTGLSEAVPPVTEGSTAAATQDPGRGEAHCSADCHQRTRCGLRGTFPRLLGGLGHPPPKPSSALHSRADLYR